MGHNGVLAVIFNALFLLALRGDSSAESRQDPLAPATSPMAKQKTQITMKIWKTIIAMAAACFAVGLWKATAQETLTIEYTLEGVEGVRHELQVDADERVLKFENIPLTSLTLPGGLTKLGVLEFKNTSLTSLILPGGLTRLSVLKVDFGLRGGNMTNLTLPEGLRSLEILGLWRCGLTNLTLPKGLVQMRDLRISTRYDTPLTSLKLPEDFGKNVKSPFRIGLQLASSIERLSVHKNMREFWIRKSGEELEELDFPSARELIRNRKPDSDGVFRIQSRPGTINVGGNGVKLGSDGVYRIETRHPLLVEVYGFQPTLTITRKADGVEIGWEAGTLQRSLLIDGPWEDVESGGTERRLFLRPSHPYEFFRVKPVSE